MKKISMVVPCYNEEGNVKLFFEDVLNTYRCQLFDYFSTTEDNYKLDGFDFSVVRTRGHTSDSVSYYFYNDKIIFTGDFLFKQSIGRTDLGGNDDDMNRSLHKIRKFPIRTIDK